jgi:putative transposase
VRVIDDEGHLPARIQLELDVHRIDGVFAVELITPDGETIVNLLEQFLIPTLMDTATRNLLGKSICLNKEYSASDVMNYIRDAFMPVT